MLTAVPDPSTAPAAGEEEASLIDRIVRKDASRMLAATLQGLAMAYKLIESAQRRWRSVSAPHLVALVRAGAVFVNGKLAERPEPAAA